MVLYLIFYLLFYNYYYFWLFIYFSVFVIICWSLSCWLDISLLAFDICFHLDYFLGLYCSWAKKTCLFTERLLIFFICSSCSPGWLFKPAPMAHSYRLGLVTYRYQVRIPFAPDICYRGCAYTVLQTVQRDGVYNAVYGTVHYKEPLKSLEIRGGHRTTSGFFLSRYCLNVQEAT